MSAVIDLGRTAMACLAVAALSGCITVSEFRMLEKEVDQLKRRDQAEATAVPVADTRVAELGAQVDDLERQIAEIRGEVERLSHEVAQRPKGRASSGAESSDRTAAAAPSTSPSPQPMPEATQEVRDYEEAFRAYRQADYKSAIDRFRSFLQNYPSSEYADNALFWMGECYFRIGDHERAVLVFEDVVKQYPEGNKVPDALYRQGLALLEIGRRDGQESTYNPAACEIFQRISTEYPNSDRVAEARRQYEKVCL